MDWEIILRCAEAVVRSDFCGDQGCIRHFFAGCSPLDKGRDYVRKLQANDYNVRLALYGEKVGSWIRVRADPAFWNRM